MLVTYPELERKELIDQSNTKLLPLIRKIRQVFEDHFDRTWFAIIIDGLPIDLRTMRMIRELVGLQSIHIGDEWFIFTHDGYWDSSQQGGELVSMVKDMEVYTIDQFAVQNNRPDIILQRLGCRDENLINHFKQLYYKRLRRLGLSQEQQMRDFHVPSTEINTMEAVGKQCYLQFLLWDEHYNLIRYNIYINDVPIFGAYGKTVTGKKVQLREQIELSAGVNKIEIFAIWYPYVRG